MKNEKIIPIFYTCNDSNVNSTVASLRSIIDNSDKSNVYSICILHDGLNKKNVKKMFDLEKRGCSITLEDLSYYKNKTNGISISFSSEFIRTFIPEMFPGYDRSLLVRNDYVASEDICAYLDDPAPNSLLFRIGC